MVGTMEKIYEISLLIDFYGQLLTKRQYEVLDLYYNDDYSLGEISEILNISRQGVHDNLKRGINILDKYEERLLLLSKYQKHKQNTDILLKLIEDLDATNTDIELKNKIMHIKNKIVEFSTQN